MMKSLLAGIALFSLISGSALAQDATGSPTALAPAMSPPVVNSYSASKTEKTIDSNGIETQSTQSYSAGAGGIRSSATSQTLAPDGTPISASQEEKTETPTGQSTTTTRSTTTTTTDQ